MKCEEYEYVEDEFTCKDCGPGRWPYDHKRSCYKLEVEYMKWGSLFSVVPASIACIGIILTIFVIILFIKNHETPLIRASGRELSYMLLFGILFCYANTFALLTKPTLATCIAQRFGIGVGFSIIYGALLTKTNRISRIFDSAAKSAKRPSYISPKSQVIIACSLIFIQILITTAWMIIEPPGARHTYPNRKQVSVFRKHSFIAFYNKIQVLKEHVHSCISPSSNRIFNTAKNSISTVSPFSIGTIILFKLHAAYSHVFATRFEIIDHIQS